MNGSSIQPEQAWQMTLDQLRLDMPKASFDTWVRDTSFVSFEAGILSVGTPNSYGREWLVSRLTSTVTRLLTGIMNQHVEIQFVVIEEEPEIEQDGLPEDEDPTQDKHPSVLTLQAEYQSIYDEIVQPDQVIVVPGYFLRYIPLLGLELSWLYIGFRQAAYEAGAAKNPGKKFGAPSKKVARYSGMSMRTFWRWVGKPVTWKRLRGLVTQVETEARWSRGKDGRPHQSARSYRVAMSLPLTSFDEHSLRAWLYRQLAQGKTPLSVLQAALETPVEELIPWPEKMASFEGAPDEPHTVQDVLFAVCGSVPESQKGQFQELADKLAHRLMPPKDLIFLTHYFVTHWLPKLGSGPGWFVTLLRDRGYINTRSTHTRSIQRAGPVAVTAAAGYESRQAPPGSWARDCPLSGRLRRDRSCQRSVPVSLVVRPAQLGSRDAAGMGGGAGRNLNRAAGVGGRQGTSEPACRGTRALAAVPRPAAGLPGGGAVRQKSHSRAGGCRG